ncbi:ABC transporter permease [Stratiformator vulcanicus]|uniref:MacB-like periplasmic core domain-containing protein n=1 Tax=Stratiformator vulcanicus TaxID=2527980 RepID=A0A517R2Z0_9PLAN|nr:ABC transporter permease [Stratiformator vulcanicus]QDT38221.1 hypothetical protein Pan189_26110 [Stratiformator vulcanicus]
MIGLVFRSLRARPTAALLLMAAIAIATATPSAVLAVSGALKNRLAERAATTPVVIGPAGSRLEVAAATLFFASAEVPPISAADWRELKSTFSGEALPIYLCGHLGKEIPLVATTPGYFRHRASRVEGDVLRRIGDVILGATAARELDARVGELLTTEPESILELVGPRPARLKVVGVLAPSDTADDKAAFVSLRTAWAIDGFGHSHGAVTESESDILDLTNEAAAALHFHSDDRRLPLTSIIYLPADERDLLMLLAELKQRDSTLGAVEPLRLLTKFRRDYDALEGTLFSVALVNVLVTLVLGLALILLVLRLRSSETRTLASLGISKGAIARLYGLELAIVMLTGMMIGGLLAWVIRWSAIG